jgi:hypothetical protein
VLRAILLLCWLPPATAADLAGIDRGIGKEPAYQGKPRYCLLAFGPEGKHKAWLVLDGDTLYVDRRGTGDLTAADCRVPGKVEPFREQAFETGDLNIGGTTYADLRVDITSVKNGIGEAYQEMPMFREFLSKHPDGKLFLISIDVPFAKPFPDVRDGSPLTKTRQFAAEYDANGILQFAARREEAPVIHFGGPWALWPDGQQKLVRGRNEDLALMLGTPGHGPGTFARISYDLLVPTSARPHVRVEYPTRPPEKALVRNYVLEDRC